MFVFTYKFLKWDTHIYWYSVSFNSLFLNNMHSFIVVCLMTGP